MLAFCVTEIKSFMAYLFQKNAFDFFLVKEVNVQTAVSYTVNGHRCKAFYSREEEEQLADASFITWGELKPQIFQMIRGSKTPQYLTITFLLPQKLAQELLEASGAKVLPEQLSGAYLNMRFQAGRLQFVTAVGYETFLPDKSFEREFENYIRSFFREHQIDINPCE